MAEVIDIIETALERVIEGLNKVEESCMKARGYTFPPDQWHSVPRKKYIALDCGGSGAFLIEKKTGEIFNIKAYGAPDKNKKLKANLGNIQSVDPGFLHARRFNYLPRGRVAK